MEKEAVQKFQPMLIQFNEEAYDIECKQANDKLELLEKGRQLALEHIEEINLKKFASHMVDYLRSEIVKSNSEMSKLGLSDNKIVYLLDKQKALVELEEIQIQYDSINAELSWRKDEPSIKVEKDKFSKWTTSSEQNVKLTAINNFIKASENMEKHFRVMKGLIPQLTSNAITVDFRKQKLKPNTILF